MKKHNDKNVKKGGKHGVAIHPLYIKQPFALLQQPSERKDETSRDTKE
jgi:hypothetical protein